MYAFYSLLVYIFYTLFRKEPSQDDGQLLEPEPPQVRRARALVMLWPDLQSSPVIPS